MKLFFSILLSLVLCNTLLASEQKYFEFGGAISGGTFSHQSPQFKGTSLSVFGPDFIANYFFNSSHAINAGLETYFSLSRLAMVGLRAGDKWYFKEPPKIEISGPFLKTTTFTKFAPFVGGELRRYTYYLSETFSSDNNIKNSGEFYDVNIHFGGDYFYRQNLKLTADISHTLLPLAVTDTRIKLAGTLLHFGFLYSY